MIYDSASEFLHDLGRGKIPLSAVSLEQWLLAHAWVMVDSGTPVIKKDVSINGAVFETKLQVRAVAYAEKAEGIVGREH